MIMVIVTTKLTVINDDDNKKIKKKEEEDFMATTAPKLKLKMAKMTFITPDIYNQGMSFIWEDGTKKFFL
jgi:hypothetical protein